MKFDWFKAQDVIYFAPKEVLSGTDRSVALAIIRHMNGSSNYAYPSLERLSQFTAYSRKTLITSIEKLVGIGLFSKTKHRFKKGKQYPHNAYTFHFTKQAEEWLASGKRGDMDDLEPDLSATSWESNELAQNTAEAQRKATGRPTFALSEPTDEQPAIRPSTYQERIEVSLRGIESCGA